MSLIPNTERLKPRSATVEELRYFHTQQHINNVKRLSDGAGGTAGTLAVVGEGSYEIALLSTGGCLTCVDAIMSGAVHNAYALVRPPGHHAESDTGMGFWYVFCIALASRSN